jgi:hypothetical protein
MVVPFDRDNSAGGSQFRLFEPDRAGGKTQQILKNSTRQPTAFGKRIRNGIGPGEHGRRRLTLQTAGFDFCQCLVVPHLCLRKQSPTFERMKNRTLTAQGFHGTIANEVFHFGLPDFPARAI